MHYYLLSMESIIKMRRCVSLSSIGKKCDLIYQKINPRLHLQSPGQKFKRVKSCQTLNFPIVKISKRPTSPGKYIIEKKQSKQKILVSSIDEKERDRQMKERIKAQISQLKTSASKSKKLTLGNYKSKTDIQKEELLPVKQSMKNVEHWKDLKKIVPKTGYLYIDCKNQPKVDSGADRKITLSKDWVLITQPGEQVLHSVEEYGQTLRKYECLSKITLFQYFRAARAFRKWRIICQYNLLKNKKKLIEGQVKGVYRQVYVELIDLLQKIRKCKFIGSSQSQSISFQQFPDYLYNCSSHLLEEIHDYLFVGCVDVCFKPIKEVILSIKLKQNQRKKTKILPDRKRMEKGKQLSKIWQKNGHFNYLQSAEFRDQFLQYFKVLKKIVYIFTDQYLQWVRGILFDIVLKMQRSLSIWSSQKNRFDDIVNSIIYKQNDKYVYYSPQYTQNQMQLIQYPCELNTSMTIPFQASQDHLFILLTQYTTFLIDNLSLIKLTQVYAQRRYGILPFQLTEKASQYVELQLLEEVIKTNDFYNSEEILQRLGMKKQFQFRLRAAVNLNFEQVGDVLDLYNTMICQFYSSINGHSKKNPSQTFEYLQAMRVKLIYLPKIVHVGVFALNFSSVHDYLLMQVNFMQTQIYINVPLQFRALFANVRQLMQQAYKGIRNSMWTVEELLLSYAAFERYEQYRVNQLHQDIQKFKGYLEVISAKCSEHYQQCFLMFVQIKEIRDKLQIKNQIFTQRLPSKLKAFRVDIQKLREQIWRNLFDEQTRVIAVCKQTAALDLKLDKLKLCSDRLSEIRCKMDKLQTIGRLQIQYFIEQQLTVNTHSYLKMNNDVNLLIAFTQKYLAFKDTIISLFSITIADMRCQDYLQRLRTNVSQIKQLYLLLIIYQTILRQILEQYQEWRQYLQTVGQIAFLTAEEVSSIKRLKELNFHLKTNITLDQCYRLNIHTIYQEIHQIKEKKIKISELNSLFGDLDSLQKQAPFQIRKAIKQHRESRTQHIGSKSRNSLESKPQAGKAVDNTKYQFQNYANIYKSLQQFQNQLKILTGSPYLIDYKLQLTLRADQLERGLGLLQMVTYSKLQYSEIMQLQLWQNHEDNHVERGDEQKWLMSQQIVGFFQNYKKQRQDIRQCWIKAINGIGKKSLGELLVCQQQVEASLRILGIKMKNIRECVDALIRKKRQQIYMLNLVDSSTVLAVIQCPAYYFQLFYPIKQIRKPDVDIQLVTLYDQILILHKADNEKDSLIQIISLELKISNQLRKLLASHHAHHPIDNLLNYINQQLPLQLIYALDQLYFASKYLTSDKNGVQIVKSLQAEIKLICRNGLRVQFDSAKVNYALALFDQLLAARIQLRTRVQHNPNAQIWYRNILVFELYQNMLTLRNFNTQILSSFHLVDNSCLAFAFPFSQKALVKVCNAMKFQQSIVVNQTEIVASIAARTMSLHYRVILNQNNIQNVLFACQQLYPVFVIGLLSNLQQDLIFVFEELNKIERINSLRTTVSKDRRLLPSIFIHCESSSGIQISETLKLRFRSVEAISPCPEILLCTKMLSYDYLIDRGLFLNTVFALKAYVILLRQKKRYYISFYDLSKLCDRLIKRISFQPIDINDQHFLFNFLKDYYQAIQFPAQDFFPSYLQGKNRLQFERSAIYDLAQSIIVTTVKEIPIIQDTAILYRLKQYESMRKAFAKFCQTLQFQKYQNSFIQKLTEIFQCSFNFQNRPLAIIGPRQSGKSMLLKLYFQYLGQTFGRGQLSCRFINVQTINLLLGPMTENDSLIQNYVSDNDDKDISWLVLQGFLMQKNISLLQHIFWHMGQQLKMKSLPMNQNSALSFCEIYHCRQKYYQQIKSLHSKYIGFELVDLKDISPAYICAMNKIYMNQNSISLATTYAVTISNFLKELVDRNEDIYPRIVEDFNQLYLYMLALLDEILLRKLKSLEWIVSINHNSGMERTLNYFFSFFHRQSRQKLDYLFEEDNHYSRLCKLLTYCFHATFQNFIQRNSSSVLQKIIKGAYYGLNQDQTRDHFLSKICYFTPKQLQYLQYDKVKQLQKPIQRQLPMSSLIQTNQMGILYRKYMKQLAEMQVPLMIIGLKECGKTSMIRLFLDKFFNAQIISKGNSTEQGIKEFNQKMRCLSGWQNPSVKDLNSQSHQGLMKKLDYVIYIDDVSKNTELSAVERYLKYIMTHQVFVQGNSLKAAPVVTSIFERRSLSQNLQQQIWNMYLINFQTNKEYFDKIFATFITNKIGIYLKVRGKKGINFQSFQKLSEKYLKIMRYCSQNYKRGHKTWIYEFNIVTLKSILSNFLQRFNYQDLLTEDELISRMNVQVFGRLKNRLIQLREVEKLQDRISCILDINEVRTMQEYNQRQNIMIACNIEQQNISNMRIKSVILTTQIKKFVPKLAGALRSAQCVLINKINVPFNRSVASVVIQMLKLIPKQITYCQNQGKFLSQIQKASELTLKKSTVSYYYISLQQIINNPEILNYISDYVQKEQPSPTIGKQMYFVHQCKFILQYSTHHYQSISNYLQANLLPYTYVLHYRQKKNQQLTEVAAKLLEDRNFNGSIETSMEEAIRIASKMFDQFQSFDAPKHMQICIYSRSAYFNSTLNFGYFVMGLLQSYNLLQRRFETKKNVLELSLSELNYMFKQYKERKAVYKQLLSEQSILLYQIGLDKDEHRRRNQEFNSIKNQNLKEAIQKNQIQIRKLIRQRDQIQSSQKIWTNIYKNAHNSISRTQFAEIKYMFLTNYSIERQLFQAIAFVLGEETDLLSLKKCFSDINIMGKIKELSLMDLSPERLKELQIRLQALAKRDKQSYGKNIIEWMKVGCRLGLHKMQRESLFGSLDARIKKLEQQSRQIRQKNRMDQMQKQLQQLQRKISQRSAELNIVHLKIKSIGNQLEQVKKQFEELIDFEGYCLQQLEMLKEHSKKLLNFCINQSIQFTFIQLLTGDSRRKFKQLINTKLRKFFGSLITKQESNYFDLLREPLDNKQQQKWLIKPKDYLSKSKKKLILQINHFLQRHNFPLAVIDRRSVLLQDTIKNNALFIRMKHLIKGKADRQFTKYNLIIIEMDTWIFSIKQSDSEYQGMGKYRIFKYKHIRLVLPLHIPVIFVMSESGEDQFMDNFKIIDLEYSVEDYYEIIQNIIIKKRVKGKDKGGLFQKMLKVEKYFMNIVYFLCRKTQNINLKSKDLIRVLTGMIQQFNKEKNQSRSSQYSSFSQDNQLPADVKLCRIVSRIIQMMITYFPSKDHTSFFFRDLLNTSFDYVEMQGVKDNQSIVYLIMELLTQGFKDKFPFIYLYYIKIFAIEEGIATIIESQNLTFIIDPREQISDCFREIDRQTTSFFKYLPYKNMQLQKIYSKIMKSKFKSQFEVVKAIQSQKGLSFFNKLLLKRALAPKSFQVQIGKIIRQFEDKITLKNKMFLRRYVVKQKLFCVCDAGFWISKLKFTDQFRLVQLSEIGRTDLSLASKNETWAVFDDMQESQIKSHMLSELMSLNSERVSTVLFSKQFLRQDYRQQFKFLPFQHLLNIFQIKQLTKVSRSKYSHIFNKVIYFKTEMLRRKPFNQRISYSFLFEKIREQIMNKQDYTVDEIILHFQWDFFLWDSSFQANHLTLHFIINSLDANPALINQFVADDKLQDRINTVISKSKNIEFDQNQICKLANQLRDSASRLDVKDKFGIKAGIKSDIYYRQFDFKRKRLVKQMETIKRISEIQMGKIQIQNYLIIELKNRLLNFSYSKFGEVLVKLINWKKLESLRDTLNIDQIQSELHLYMLFQNSLYLFYQLFNIELQNLKDNKQKNKSNQDIPSPSDTSNRSHSILQKQKTHQKSSQSITSNRKTRLSRVGSYAESQERSRADSKRPFKSFSAVKQLLNKNRRLSISLDPNHTQLDDKQSQQQLAQQFFKDSLYVVQNRVIGLKRIGIKEQRTITLKNPRTFDLPHNRFSLKIIQLSDLIINGQATELAKGSRFGKN